MIRWLLALTLLFLSACTEAVPEDGSARVLVMGDSLMAFNGAAGRGVADGLEAALGVPVVDRAVAGARYFHALPISGAAGMRIDAQYRPGDWDWVVLNGGGNDLLLGCGCGPCAAQLDRLISADGRAGAIPDLVARFRGQGARVLYTGYLRTPGITSPVEACGPLGDAMDRRLAAMAARDPGVVFVSLARLVPDGDDSYHARDLIHPSPRGSAAIAALVARRIADHR
ncbi:MAG: GDSL-like lipase [Rhodobacteraceae bacterium HLUCCA08]|nr:MAG: GDSL-like lipase [Rhodobacteraceae bacterium HLUCCA08]